MTAFLSDGLITPDEETEIHYLCEEFNINDSDHYRTLLELGCSAEDFAKMRTIGATKPPNLVGTYTPRFAEVHG